MSTLPALPTVAILNSSEDLLTILSRFLNAEGYVTVTQSMTQVKLGDAELSEFILQHGPKIIIYDIAFPYDENWLYCRNVMQLEVCQNIQFILTTPNLEALEKQIGTEVNAFEIIGKDTDLQKIVAQVNKIWQEKVQSHS